MLSPVTAVYYALCKSLLRVAKNNQTDLQTMIVHDKVKQYMVIWSCNSLKIWPPFHNFLATMPTRKNSFLEIIIVMHFSDCSGNYAWPHKETKSRRPLGWSHLVLSECHCHKIVIILYLALKKRIKYLLRQYKLEILLSTPCTKVYFIICCLYFIRFWI